MANFHNLKFPFQPPVNFLNSTTDNRNNNFGNFNINLNVNNTTPSEWLKNKVLSDSLQKEKVVVPAKNTTVVKPVPKIQNIVSTVNLCVKLELSSIALQARNTDYNPRRFAALVMRLKKPRTTALIFSSGKLVCTGAKSVEDSKLASRRYARIIQKLGFKTKFADFKVQNIVGSCDVKFSIKLDIFRLRHSDYCTYEPELFPGLVYRMMNPKIVLLVFMSGKIVLTGANKQEDINKAFDKFYNVLIEFPKDR